MTAERRKRTGQLKLAKEKAGRDAIQYCIDGVLVKEVLETLPRDIIIIGAKVIVGKGFNKHKVPISNKLKKLGVMSLRENLPAKEATLVFDETNKTTILEKTKAVAEILGAEVEKAYFSYLTLSNKAGSGKFSRVNKDMRPDDTDLRKKLTVLGLDEATGDVQSLVRDLSAEAYQCNIQEVVVRSYTCKKV